MKSKRGHHHSTIIGDKMYVVYGFDDSDLADTEIIPISIKNIKLNSTITTIH